MVEGLQWAEKRRGEGDALINALFRDARLNKGYSMAELASETGIKKGSLYSYQALNSFPAPDRAERIARALGTTAERIFPESMRRIFGARRVETTEVPSEDYKEGSPQNPLALDSVNLAEQDVNGGLFELNCPDVLVQQRDAKFYLDDLLGDLLDERARAIVERRWRTDGVGRPTLEMVGEEHGISYERVRQIEAKALHKLRFRLRWNFAHLAVDYH